MFPGFRLSSWCAVFSVAAWWRSFGWQRYSFLFIREIASFTDGVVVLGFFVRKSGLFTDGAVSFPPFVRNSGLFTDKVIVSPSPVRKSVSFTDGAAEFYEGWFAVPDFKCTFAALWNCSGSPSMIKWHHVCLILCFDYGKERNHPLECKDRTCI